MDCITKVRRALEYRTDTREPTGIIMTREFHDRLRKELTKSKVFLTTPDLFGLRIIVADKNYPADTILKSNEFIITPMRYG
jgi:hypothetical protein